MKHLDKSDLCTHGRDPAPLGVNIENSVAPVTARESTAASATCIGDGISGARTQVIYVRAADVADRYTTYLASFRTWASEADNIYQASATKTGGARAIRFVHDAACNIMVDRVTVSSTGDDTFDNTITELQAAGYNRADRKYMIFVDASVYCGIGGIAGDDQPGLTNANNTGPSYGRTDSGCWGGHTAAHEHMHNLGGVQLSAPHSSGGYHCVDEYDVMCYSDSPNYPAMQILCADSSQEYRFDCGNDDYFNTSPPVGSYLDTHWNAANSQFLTNTATPPPPPPCPDQAFEPDDTAAQARSFLIGATESHAFCASADQDWVKFNATANAPYRLETLNLSTGTDTVLNLYGSDGTTLLTTNDDSGAATYASVIDFTPTTSGTYFAKASQYNGAGDVGYTYDLKVTGGPAGADVAVTVTAPQTMVVGDVPTYTVKATNNGPSVTAVDLTLSMDAPPYAVATTTQGSCAAMTSTYDLSCALGNLAAGATATVKVQVAQASSGSRYFTARVYPGAADPVSTNNTRTVNRTVAAAPVGVTGEVATACTTSGTPAGDTLVGGSGNDVLCGFGGADTLSGLAGDDALVGGPDVDTVSYTTATGGLVANLTNQDAYVPTRSNGNSGYDVYRSVEWARGSAYNDTLYGFTTKAERLYGLGGADTIYGYAGNDLLYGGGGNDTIRGGDGDDSLYGNAGNDALYGENGNDLCAGSTGTNTISSSCER